MTISLLGSSRELKHRRFLPPIDLLDHITGKDPSAADFSSSRLSPRSKLGAHDEQEIASRNHKMLLAEPQTSSTAAAAAEARKKVGAGGGEGADGPFNKTALSEALTSPRSSAGDSILIEDLSSFLALLRGGGPPAGCDAHQNSQLVVTGEANTGVTAVGTNPMITLQTAGKGGLEALEARREKSLPRVVYVGETANVSTRHHNSDGKARSSAGRSGPFTAGGSGGKREGRTAVIDSRRRKKCSTAEAVVVNGTFTSNSGAGACVSARAPARRRRSMPSYTRPTSSTGSCRVCQRSKSRRPGECISISASAEDPRRLRLCPTLEARILDLRRDNTAAAQFLSKANKRAREFSELLRRRQRFFLVVVFAVGATLRLRNKWKERKSLMDKIAEIIAAGKKAGSNQEFEISVVRLQRFFRSRQRKFFLKGNNNKNKNNMSRRASVFRPHLHINLLHRLKDWIQRVRERRKNRRRGATVILSEFLRDARLFQNIAAIYRFRKRVINCQVYARRFLGITLARLELLDLYYQRCEERLRGGLAERVRLEVTDEAIVDLKIHRQIMHPLAAEDRRTGARAGKSNGDDDLRFMEMVAKMRLRSALEELETRVAHPAVKRRLLCGLLVKVRADHRANIRLAAERRKHRDRYLGGGIGGRRRQRCCADSKAREAVFTIADAREFLLYHPPTTHFSAVTASSEANEEGKTTKQRRRVQHVSGSAAYHSYSSSHVTDNDVAGSWTGASCSPDAAAAEAGTLGTGSGHHEGKERRSFGEVSEDAVIVAGTSTRVPPMLLLRAVSESTMNELVLAAWEQSSTNGSSRNRVSAKEDRTKESGDREAPRCISLSVDSNGRI